MMTPEFVSIIVVGLGLGIAELRRRREEKKVSSQVVVAASTVEKKTDDQTEMLKDIAHDLRGVRQAQLATNEAVGLVDQRLERTTTELTTAHRETSKRLDGIDTRQIETDRKVDEHGRAISTLSAEVALIKQAGGMRKADTPAKAMPALAPPRKDGES